MGRGLRDDPHVQLEGLSCYDRTVPAWAVARRATASGQHKVSPGRVARRLARCVRQWSPAWGLLRGLLVAADGASLRRWRHERALDRFPHARCALGEGAPVRPIGEPRTRNHRPGLRCLAPSARLIEAGGGHGHALLLGPRRSSRPHAQLGVAADRPQASLGDVHGRPLKPIIGLHTSLVPGLFHLHRTSLRFRYATSCRPMDVESPTHL